MMTTAQSDIAADLDAFSETTWFNSAFLVRNLLFSHVQRIHMLMPLSLDCHVQPHTSLGSTLPNIHTSCIYSFLLHIIVNWSLRDSVGSDTACLPFGTSSYRMWCWWADGYCLCLDPRLDEQEAPGSLHRSNQRRDDYRCLLWGGAGRSSDAGLRMGEFP